MRFSQPIHRFRWRWLAAPLLAAGLFLPLLASALAARPALQLPITNYKLPSSPLPNCTPNVVNYDIVYVRAPRYGDYTNSVWPEDVRPLEADPGGQLRLLHPDCTDELLFPRLGTDAALEIGRAHV